MVLSTAGIIYFASNPAVNTCTAPYLDGLGPAVCVYQKSVNWTGIGTSAAALVLSVGFIITYGYTNQKKK